MADISKIQVSGVEYDIKDQVAREALENAAGLEWKSLEKKCITYQYKEDEYSDVVTTVDYGYIDPIPMLREASGIFLLKCELWGTDTLYMISATEPSFSNRTTVFPLCVGNGDEAKKLTCSHQLVEVYEPEYLYFDADVIICEDVYMTDVLGDCTWTYAKV